MKALLFHKFRNICIKTILWTRNTNCFTIFLHSVRVADRLTIFHVSHSAHLHILYTTVVGGLSYIHSRGFITILVRYTCPPGFYAEEGEATGPCCQPPWPPWPPGVAPSLPPWGHCLLVPPLWEV